ncbi:MAG: tyrosine-type recombinase/integrase [Limosilactobacillus reuteri]|nr:tyrosine-type recombinase/integrase [Limosilactobacillus reuteri]
MSDTEKLLLQYFEKKYNISVEDALNDIETMKNNEIIAQHPYRIFQGTNGRWYTYLPDETKNNGRRQIAKSTEAKIHEAIIKDYKQKAKEKNVQNLNLENIFSLMMKWRLDTGTEPKTIKENFNEWKRFLSTNKLIKKKVSEIDFSDIEDFFLEITKDHAITYKRLTNVKSVLNGVFKHAVRLKIIKHSPMPDVDYTQFHTRCKPSNTRKENYTDEERTKMLKFLACVDDPYSYCIQLSLFLCLRIGELIVVQKSDIQDNILYINRSIRKNQDMNDDLTFGSVYYTVEERIKGNQDDGFREIPLTPKALEIVNKAIAADPHGKYLFMKNGKPLYADSFNRYLKEKVCIPLNIPYRPSHQIRFTTATKLYESGMPVNQLSNLLGHSDTRTTFHYIRQKKADPKAASIMVNALDV